jgi:FkbM family methyltransferase
MYHAFKWTRRSLYRNDLTRHYEPLQPHLLVALARRFECDTFLDIGANIGVYSLFLSQVTSIKAIHSFEPTPDTFAELQKNLEANGINAAPHNKAVSDRPATLKFGIVYQLSGANSVIDTSIHQRFERQIEVDAVRLDDYLPLRDARLCIKIDVEGHERQVLAGMGDLLMGNRVVLQIEDYGEKESDLPALLAQQGLKPLFRIGPDRYFTNIETAPSDREIVELFESAAKEMVAANLALLEASHAQDKGIAVPLLGKSLTLQVGGRLGRFGRAAAKKLRRN